MSRFVGTFNITVVLYNLNISDSGTYVAIADIRRPSNNQRVTITFKNFSLNVVDPMGKVLYTHAHTQTLIMVLLSIPVYDQCQNLMQLCADMGANVSPLRKYYYCY